MKRILLGILFLSFSTFLSAQYKCDRNVSYTLALTGDSTLLIEKYEINFKKREIYYITPIMNYLDFKGVKYRTSLRISSEKWKQVCELIGSTNFVHLDSLKNRVINGPKYVLELFIKNEKQDQFIIAKEEEPNDLKRLFEFIKK
jgi:hypothetical protein